MKKYVFAALFALVFAVPGMAEMSVVAPRTEMASPEMDPQLVQSILKAAAEQSEYSYAELQGMYDDGTATIDKVPGYYRVTIGGGIVEILIEDSL